MHSVEEKSFQLEQAAELVRKAQEQVAVYKRKYDQISRGEGGSDLQQQVDQYRVN
jgi:hypothetical protein